MNFKTVRPMSREEAIHKNEVAKLEAENRTAQSQITYLKEELAPLKEQNANRGNQIAKLEEQIRIMQSKDPNRDFWKLYENEVAELKAEIEMLKDSRAALDRQEQASRNECSRLRGDLQISEAKLVRLVRALQMLRSLCQYRAGVLGPDLWNQVKACIDAGLWESADIGIEDSPIQTWEDARRHLEQIRALCDSALKSPHWIEDKPAGEKFKQEHPFHDCQLGGYLITVPKP